MDVTLPDGTTINNVPEGMSKAELVAKLKANGHDTSWYKEEVPQQPKQTVEKPLAKQSERQTKSIDDILSGYADMPFLKRAGAAVADVGGGMLETVAGLGGLPAMLEGGVRQATGKLKGLSGDELKEYSKPNKYSQALADLVQPETATGKGIMEGFGALLNSAKDTPAAIVSGLEAVVNGEGQSGARKRMEGRKEAWREVTGPMVDIPAAVAGLKAALPAKTPTPRSTTAKISPELVKQIEAIQAERPQPKNPDPYRNQPAPQVPVQLEGLPRDVEVPGYPRTAAENVADKARLKEITEPIDTQEVRSPYDLQETPPELAELNKEPVRDPSTGTMIAPEQAMPEMNGVPMDAVKAPEAFIRDPSTGTMMRSKQGGYIDPSVFKEGFEKARDSVVNGIKFIARSTGVDGRPEFDGLNITAIDTKTGKKVGELGLNKQDILAKPEDTNLQANDVPGVNVHPEYQGKGIAQDMYKFASELGADIVPSDRQTSAGKGFWDKMQKAGVADKTGIKSPGNKQSGAFTPFSSTKKVNPIEGFKNLTEFRKAMEEAGHGEQALGIWKKNGGRIRTSDLAPMETEFANYAKNFGKNKDDAYEANRDLIKQSSDQAPGMFGRNAMPGGASMKRYLDSPAATWAINLIDGAKKAGNLRAEAAIDKIGELTKGMTTLFGSSKDLHKEINAYVKGEAPSSDTGGKLHEGLKKLFDSVYEPLNEAYKQKQIDGGTLPENVKTLPKLENYFPHMWEGPFGFKIVDPETGRTMTVVREKSAAQVEKARKYITEQLEAKGQSHQFEIGPTEYNKLLDSSKFQQDVGLVSQQFMEALDLLADSKDPVIQHKMELLDNAMRREAWNSASGFKKHTENRIGVTGWKGNKPWESDAVNAKDAIEASHKYFRDAHTFIESQRANSELRKFYEDNPDKPNTIGYVEQAYKQAFVGLENKLGPVMAKLQDAYSNTTGFSAGSAKNFVRGIKSVVTAATLTSTRNAIAQIIQAPQSLISELVRNKQMKGGPTSVGTALITGLVQSILYPTNKVIKAVSGKADLISTPKTREITKYMLENGITDTYAMDAAYHHNPSLVKAGMDRVMGAGLRLPDQIGRVWTFTSLVKSFEEAGFPLKDAMDKSRDLTDVIMNSGAKHNQAPVYQKLGMAGEMAGNVQSFKHNTLTQLAYDIKAVKDKDPGARTALVTKLSGILATSGVIGMVGVAEADQILKLIKQISGDADVINVPGVKESIYIMLPPELSMGVLSSSTGVDLAGTFASPQVVSDNLTDMIWPLGGRAIDMAEGLGQAAKGVITGNKYAQIAGTAKAAPDIPGLKGFLEKKMSVPGKDGNILVERPNSGNRTIINRTPEQQSKRMWGLTDLDESMNRKLGYEVIQDETLRKGAMRDIVNKIPEVFAENTINKELGVEWKSRLKELQMKYLQLGGDPDKFIGAAAVAAKGRASRSQVVSMLKLNAKDMESLQKNKRIMDRFKRMNDQ